MPTAPQPIRVLHVSSGNLYGGVERLLAILASHARLAPGMDPHFALCFVGTLSDELLRTRVPLHLLPPARMSRPWSVLRTQLSLARVLGQTHFDMVVIHNYWPHLIFAPVVKARRVPIAFFAHEIPNGRDRLERWAAHLRPNLVLANSRQSASRMNLLFPNIATEVYAGPVLPISEAAIRARADVRRELDTPADDVVIVHAARLASWKGHETLLRALGALRGVRGWRCWMTSSVQQPGEAEYLANLQAIARKEGVGDRVQFLGNRPDVASLMAAADIHCQPNEGAEPWGRVFVEALYAGLPVVTTAIGGALEIVDASCGVLVPPREPDLLARALRDLIENGERRKALGAAGPERAAAVADPRASIRKLESLLRSSLAGALAAAAAPSNHSSSPHTR